MIAAIQGGKEGTGVDVVALLVGPAAGETVIRLLTPSIQAY